MMAEPGLLDDKHLALAGRWWLDLRGESTRQCDAACGGQVQVTTAGARVRRWWRMMRPSDAFCPSLCLTLSPTNR